MQNEQKIIIKGPEFSPILFVVLNVFGVLIGLMGVGFGVYGEPAAYLLLLFPALCAGLTIFSYRALKKNAEETEFNALGIIKRVNGEVKGVYYWDCFMFANITTSTTKQIFTELKNTVNINMSTIDENGAYTNVFITFEASGDELYAIQNIAPVVLFEQKYLTGIRRSQIADIEKMQRIYQNNPLLEVSIRARVAYLICCIESVILHYGEPDEKDVKLLEFLWKYTSALKSVEAMQALHEQVEIYKNQFEAFPDYAPTNLENITCLQNWLNDLKQYLNFDPFENYNKKQELINEILVKVESVAKHIPENDDYAYHSVSCCQTLQDIDAVNSLLKSENIVLPILSFVPEIHTFAQYFNYDRTEAYGIGSAFNGAKTYSKIIFNRVKEEDKKPKFESKIYAKSQSEVYRHSAYDDLYENDLGTPDEVYDDYEQLIAPTINTRGSKSYWLVNWHMPKYFIALFIMGLILSVAAIGFFVLYVNLREQALQVFVMLFCPMGNLFLISFFYKRQSEQENRYYPLKWLDLILILLFGGVHFYGILYVFDNYGIFDAINVIYLIEFTLISSAYAAQFITLVLTPQNKKIEVDYSNVDFNEEKYPQKNKLHDVQFYIAQIVFAFALAIASVVFLVLFKQASNQIFGVLTVFFAISSSLIFGFSQMVVKGVRLAPKKQKSAAVLMLLSLLVLGIVGVILTGDILVNSPIDMYVPIWLVVVAVYRLVILIAAMLRSRKDIASYR